MLAAAAVAPSSSLLAASSSPSTFARAGVARAGGIVASAAAAPSASDAALLADSSRSLAIARMRIFAERDGVSIAPSPGKGHGVFAARHIPAEVSVGDYAGDILSQRDVEVRYEAAPRAHALWCEADEAWLRRRGALGIGCSGDYIFRVGDDTFVDSEEYATANWTRFLNHGADANLRVKSLLKGMDGRPRVWFQALRDIEPGEELLWDYGESYWRASDVVL